jgi:hypothetical protein
MMCSSDWHTILEHMPYKSNGDEDCRPIQTVHRVTIIGIGVAILLSSVLLD